MKYSYASPKRNISPQLSYWVLIETISRSSSLKIPTTSTLPNINNPPYFLPELYNHNVFKKEDKTKQNLLEGKKRKMYVVSN